MNFLRETLVGGDVEFFNGSIWKPISKYKKDEKVLIYYEDKTVALSTPIEYIKINKPNINHVESSMFVADINDDATFYGIERENLTTDIIKTMTFKDAYLGDFHYFSHYELISTFDNSDIINRSMLSEDKLKIMTYAVMLGKIKNNDCKIKLNSRGSASYLLNMMKKNKVRYKYDEKSLTLEFRPPRDIEAFIHNPLIFSQKEIMIMTHLIIDTLISNKGEKLYITPVSKDYLDFIQFVLALGGKRANIVGDKLRLLKGRYCRLQAKCFKIEEKRVKTQYSFTVKSGLIVFRSNGLIYVLSDYKKPI